MKLLTTILAAATLAAAQQTPPAEITIAQAVETALRNYPSVRVTQEQMNAAAAAIRLAQTAYLPRVDGLLQVNRATRNTFYGLLLPQSVIPGVDGVKADNLGTVFDSGAGVLVSWQPFDFGLRRANVAVAEAARDQAQAALNKTRYEISVAAADAFLTVLAARQTAEAARAAVDSWQILQRSIQALVNAQLRPGADESRVAAELAGAQTQVAQAEQAIEIARVTLSEFVGLDPSQLSLNPGKLTEPARKFPNRSSTRRTVPWRGSKPQPSPSSSGGSMPWGVLTTRSFSSRAWPPAAAAAWKPTAHGSGV
jgi:outer membrane protein